MNDLSSTHLWEKTPQETPLAFSYFACWRDLGPSRSFVLAAAKLQVRPNLLHALAARYGWARRADAWDAHLDRQRQQAQIDAVRDMESRHALLAMLVQEKVALRLEGMTDEEVRTISHADLVRMLTASTGVERQARGADARAAPAQINVHASSSSHASSASASEAGVVQVVETVVRTREEVAAARLDPRGEIINGD